MNQDFHYGPLAPHRILLIASPFNPFGKINEYRYFLSIQAPLPGPGEGRPSQQLLFC